MFMRGLSLSRKEVKLVFKATGSTVLCSESHYLRLSPSLQWLPLLPPPVILCGPYPGIAHVYCQLPQPLPMSRGTCVVWKPYPDSLMAASLRFYLFLQSHLLNMNSRSVQSKFEVIAALGKWEWTAWQGIPNQHPLDVKL